MVDSNNEFVGKALELLKEGLRPIVVRYIDSALASGVWSTTELRLYSTNNRLSNYPGEWDVHALLLFMQRLWSTVFRPVLGMPPKDLVGELIGHRNIWAHQGLFSTDDAHRAVDSTLRLLESVKAPQTTVVAPLRMELLRLLTAEQPAARSRPKALYCTETCPCWGMPTEGPRICPICDKEFKNQWNGWEGIDSHYKARHKRETGIPYKQWWNSICPEHGGPGKG